MGIMISIVVWITGLLGSYLAGSRNRICYILGLINYLLAGFIAFLNGFYGVFAFFVFVFAPFQIYGFLVWGKNLNKKHKVKIKQFTLLKALIITASCLFGSIILGMILSRIPGQNLAILDAISNCLGLCALILTLARYKESWWLWIVHSLISISIWIFAVMQNGDQATTMLIMNICFLLLNIRGAIKWTINLNKKKKARV